MSPIPKSSVIAKFNQVAPFRFGKGVICKYFSKSKKWRIGFLFLATLPLSALEPIRITEPEGKIVLGLHTEYMEDKDGKLRFGDVRQMETHCNAAIGKDAINRVSTITTEPCWNKSEQKNLNFGQTTSVYWVKFQIANEQDHYNHWLLEISYPFLDKIYFYSPDVTGDFFC